MKRYILLFLFGLMSAMISGQSLLQDKDSSFYIAPFSVIDESYTIPWTPTDAFVPPSPEAVWQNRYVSYPISHSTGTVQVSIPLCDLPVKDIPLNVSLSYHTGGIKVDDVASSVGLGWSLQAGGSISRVINGQPDELLPFDIQTHGEVMQSNDMQYLEDLQHYDADANYDRYYYHFDGHSGSFICNPSDGRITQLPPTPDVITRIENADGSFDFTIRTLSGATYYFTEREHSTYEFSPSSITAYYRSPNYHNVPTGWLLTRIVSPQERDEVTLSYNRVPQWQRSRSERNSSSFFEVDDRGTAVWNDHEYATLLSSSHRTTFPDQLILSRISSSRFGSLEFTSLPITGGASAGQPNIRMSSIQQKDCAGNVIRTIVFDNDHKDLSGKLTLLGVTVTDNGKLSDKRIFAYYPGGSPDSSKDFFGYSNAGLTRITSESVLNTHGELAVNRRHHFGSAVGGALKSVTDATGAVTTYRYESNTCDAFATPVSIGLRVKQILVSDPVSGKLRLRTFTYEHPRCTIDFDRLHSNAFISVSGCITGMITTPLHTYYSSSAVLTASCRISGFRPENAVIYYGKVTEELTGTSDTDTIRTVYEYDTSDCEHPFIPMAGGSKPSMTLTPERYLGEKLDCTNLNRNENARRYLLFSAQSAGGYFRETAWEKAPLVRKITYRKTVSGFEPAEEAIHTYELHQNNPFLTGFHVESLVRTRNRGGIEQEDFQTVNDFHYYELTSATGTRYKTGTRYISYYTDGSSREVQKEYKYDSPLNRIVIPPTTSTHKSISITPVYPNLPGFGREARYAFTQQPIAVITRCGEHSFAHYTCYSSNMLQAPYTQMVQAGMRDLPAMERWVVDETDTLTLKYEYGEFAICKYNLLRKTLMHDDEEVSVQDFIRYDIYGNLLETSVNHLPATSFVYGYKHSLPVAVIKGEGYDSINPLTQQLLGTHSGLSSFSETLRNILDGIRQRDSSLTEIYEYRPMIGISRHTAPNGASTSYDYVGRMLGCITDCEGKTVSEYAYALKAEGGDNRMTSRQYLYGTREYREQTTMYDGLGLPYLLCDKGAATSGKNLLALKEYDNQLRETKTWLPIACPSENVGNFSTLSQQFYNDATAFLTQIYEPMENGRLTASQQPGSDLSGKKQTKTYRGNLTDIIQLMCRRYVTTTDGQLSSNGLYAPGELEVCTEIDEDGHTTYTFTDFTGKTLLTRCMKGLETFDTYYVYDPFGKLRFVLTPEATELHTNGTWNIADNSVLRNHAYYYRYDGKYRLVEQKQPGREPVYTKYDMSGTSIFTQDGNQRERQIWRFCIPDRYGRPALQGECPAACVPDISNVVVNCTFNATSQGWEGSHYEVSGMSLSDITLHQVFYYDGYQFLETEGFSDRTAFPLPTVNAKGYQTGNMMNSAAGPIYSAFYYDPKGRMTRQVQSNLAGGYDMKDIQYSFTGKPEVVTHLHTATNQPSVTENYAYTYDPNERLTKVEHTLGGVTVTLVSNTYDELGRLQSKTLHGLEANRLTYSYNLRDWLTAISGNKFSQNLYYNTGNGTPCYNGNISSITWQAGGETILHGYKFTYDGLNRMLDAVYGEGTSISSNANRFTEMVTGYDKNGNILALQRYGQTGASSYGLIDNLTFTLDGNQLNRVDDAVTASAYNNGFEFKDAVKQANEYAYDANGNLTKDLNKNISNIQYNCLNLPSKVTFTDGSTIEYTYAADGTKLRTKHVINGTTTTTDYCGNVIYENGVQKLLLTEAGYVTLADSKYHYYLQDHQGNNRVVIDQNGTVEETNHYYPFGGVFASTSSVQPYKYNGKELDTKKGLNWYDYGARHYDAAIGRFATVDPMAEKYYSMSPYVYCANNPMKFVDSDGKQLIIPPTFFGMNPPILGTSNPIIATGRNIGMLGTSDKIVKALPKEEHHIIPRSLKGNDVIKTAKEGGFKLEGKGNKISVDKFSKATGEGQHAKHPNYTRQIEQNLKEAFNKNPRMTPEQAVDVVKEISSKAKNAIENNPNIKINDLKLEQQVLPMDNTKILKPTELIKVEYKNPWHS